LKAVSNTTPLIYLSKSSLLPLLKTLHQSVLITEEVYEEAIIKGESRGYKDALSIKNAVRDWILVKKVSGDILLHLMDRMPKERLDEIIKSLVGLSEADISTIALAIEEKADRVILDDRAAIKAAKLIADVCGFRVIGTGNLIDEGLEKGFISKSDYERFVEVIGHAAYAA